MGHATAVTELAGEWSNTSDLVIAAHSRSQYIADHNAVFQRQSLRLDRVVDNRYDFCRAGNWRVVDVFHESFQRHAKGKT